jgi:DNA-directed RNA polymerase specialized sigma24 family protein
VNSQTDQQLLRDYAENGVEAAFGELVGSHVDFVYSAALRMVCDAHLAEDVTQGVFVALAQNAGQLAARPDLSGWLHCTARNLGAKAVRSEVRRHAREQEAAAMNDLLSSQPDSLWERIAPTLDAALGELSDFEEGPSKDDSPKQEAFANAGSQATAGMTGFAFSKKQACRSMRLCCEFKSNSRKDPRICLLRTSCSGALKGNGNSPRFELSLNWAGASAHRCKQV